MPNEYKDRIALGSGDVYTMEYSSGAELPTDAEIEKDENKLGEVKGGASVSYSATFYTAESDNGVRKKSIMQTESASLKCGIITWNGEVFEKLCQTARVNTTTVSGKRTVKIGGMKNFKDKKYIIRFVHKDEIDGDCRLTILGSNQGGFELSFAKDKETIINPEFIAFPCDDEGTLIIYEEDILPKEGD